MPATMMSWGNRTIRRRAAGPVLAALIALGAVARATTPGSREIFLPDPPKLTESALPGLREHQRVLAAYGGAYDDPKLQALLTRVVNRLVAASTRPEVAYKVTILNSPASCPGNGFRRRWSGW
jgi:predicted Zn-dependent protease